MWNKPKTSITNQEACVSEFSKEELMEVNGGLKIGVCAVVGLGGNTSTGQTPVITGICYVIGI